MVDRRAVIAMTPSIAIAADGCSAATRASARPRLLPSAAMIASRLCRVGIAALASPLPARAAAATARRAARTHRARRLPPAEACRSPRNAARSRCPRTATSRDGRKITLAVAVLPANTLHSAARSAVHPRRRPGPGGDVARGLRRALTGVRKDRDIVLVDQRGTGRSSPLDCAAFKPDRQPRGGARARSGAEGAPPAPQELAAQRRRCRAIHDGRVDRRPRRRARGARLRAGSTCGAAATARASRRNTCAGIRERVRSVVLDGVAPPSMTSSSMSGRRASVALDAVLDACAQSPACTRRASRSRGDARRDSRPARRRRHATSTLADPRTGEAQTMHLTFDARARRVAAAHYPPELAALLPEIIARAARRRLRVRCCAGAMLVTGDLDEQSNAALHYSVTCAEDVPRVTAADARARARTAAQRRRSRERALAVCDVWPQRRDARRRRDAGRRATCRC